MRTDSHCHDAMIWLAWPILWVSARLYRLPWFVTMSSFLKAASRFSPRILPSSSPQYQQVRYASHGVNFWEAPTNPAAWKVRPAITFDDTIWSIHEYSRTSTLNVFVFVQCVISRVCIPMLLWRLPCQGVSNQPHRTRPFRRRWTPFLLLDMMFLVITALYHLAASASCIISESSIGTLMRTTMHCCCNSFQKCLNVRNWGFA